jgi:ketosteroid isomerase-like protein
MTRNTAWAMSQENVEIVRALIPPPDVDVAALFRDDSLFEQATTALELHIDPRVETVAVWQGATTYAGVEGFRQMWLDWLEPWTSYHTSADELIDAGDCVVALARDHGSRGDTDAEVELISGSVWEVRDGKIVRVQFYGSRDEALEAVGLRE